MTRLIAIDPGMESGVFIGEFDRRTPLTVNDQFQVTGGVQGFYSALFIDRYLDRTASPDVVVFERFTPRPMGRQYRREELEPLVIEGLIYGMFPPEIVAYQSPQSMLINGGSGAEGKRNADRLLRNLGLHMTGADVGRPDANDANAATKHALAYMVSIGHEPTIRLLDQNRD